MEGGGPLGSSYLLRIDLLMSLQFFLCAEKIMLSIRMPIMEVVGEKLFELCQGALRKKELGTLLL